MPSVDTVERQLARDLVAADPILAMVHDYIESLRGARAMAALADIDFFAIPKAVPHLFTMTVAGVPPRFRYKFTGTAVDAIMGQNALNKYLDEIYPTLGHKVIEAYAQFAADPRPQLMQASFTTAKGIARTILRYILPLGADGRTLSHVIGVLVQRAADPALIAPPPPSRPNTLLVEYI